MGASRTLVLHPDIKKRPSKDTRLPQSRLQEAVGLAHAIALDIIDAQLVVVNAPRPAALFGQGRVEELGAFIKAEGIELVSVDATLTPVQQRNLERAWDCKVIDRTGLILEIFGDRARTREGKLQVELASLNYQKSRLVRSWTHLERQRGGMGKVGGPGETQIEMDRRLIRERIAKIKRQLETVLHTRSLHRKLRRETPFPLVALVGYTNAGKSTLFNRLTGDDSFAADALFATLDPTIRRLKLPSGQVIMLSDTVGFISHLPTDLIAAFRATLEEVCEADFILHIRDISHPDTAEQKADVQTILKTLLEEGSEVPCIEVHNKIDLLEDAYTTTKEEGFPLCALTGEGVAQLLAKIDTELGQRTTALHRYRLPCSAGRALAWLHQHGQAMSSREEEDMMMEVEVRLSPANAARFEVMFGGGEN